MQRKDEFALGGKYVTREGFNFNEDSFSKMLYSVLIDLNLSQETHENLSDMYQMFIYKFNQKNMFRTYSWDEVKLILLPLIREMILENFSEYNQNINTQLAVVFIVIRKVISKIEDVKENHSKNVFKELSNKELSCKITFNNYKYDNEQLTENKKSWLEARNQGALDIQKILEEAGPLDIQKILEMDQKIKESFNKIVENNKKIKESYNKLVENNKKIKESSNKLVEMDQKIKELKEAIEKKKK